MRPTRSHTARPVASTGRRSCVDSCSTFRGRTPRRHPATGRCASSESERRYPIRFGAMDDGPMRAADRARRTVPRHDALAFVLRTRNPGVEPFALKECGGSRSFFMHMFLREKIRSSYLLWGVGAHPWAPCTLMRMQSALAVMPSLLEPAPDCVAGETLHSRPSIGPSIVRRSWRLVSPCTSALPGSHNTASALASRSQGGRSLPSRTPYP